MNKVKNFFYNNICIIIAVILILVLIISLIPILTISFYNYPTRDDYFLGYNVYKSHDNFIETIKSGFDRANIAYNNWQGLFTVNILLSFMPYSFGSEYYAITTFIGILSLIISTMYFAYQLLVKLLKFDKVKYSIILTIILFINIQLLPSAVQGFYWYASVITYTLSYSFMLTLFGMITSYIQSNKKNKDKRYFSPLLFLTFLVSGCNYIVLLFSLLLLLIIFIYLFKKRNKGYIIIAFNLLLMLVGLIISVLAPGNMVRSTGEEGMSAIAAILISFPAAIRSILNIFSNLPTLVAVFVIIPFLYNAIQVNSYSFKFKHPLIILFVSLCLYASTFTSTYYAMYGSGLERVENIRMFMLLWLVIINIFYIIGYLNKSIIKSCNQNNITTQQYKNLVLILTHKYRVGIAIVFAILYISSMYNYFNKFTTTSATISLISGEAKQYKKEQLEREELYFSDNKSIEVKKLSVKPYVLYFWDISDSDSGRYEAMEKYFHKKSITIK